jgi:hypothetical protein
MKLPYFFVKPAVTLPLLVASVFALHAPIEWASSAYWPDSLISLISYIFPPIAGYAKKSHFPVITQAYMAFTFMLMPLHGWYTYKALSEPTNEPWFKNLWTIDSYWALAKRVCSVILIGAIVWFSIFLNPGYDFNLMPLNTSRNALGVGGWIVAGGGQGHLLAWIFCNLLVIKNFFGSK